ncbi:hypothetical protein Taro_014390 [Colocasia esculenta]|uniref:Uncharacterized protein n=1 Tax=Colocasia esculenta TaxID=4460 RepID=A0A843UEE6_COLES|nr:hypothetical protein [Colocasia esculenta]
MVAFNGGNCKKREERGEQQALAAQGPTVLPPPPPPSVDYGVFMQGLVQAMSTQAQTQAALQAQLQAQAGDRDGLVYRGEVGSPEEVNATFPEVRQEEGSGVPVATTFRSSSKLVGSRTPYIQL